MMCLCRVPYRYRVDGISAALSSSWHVNDDTGRSEGRFCNAAGQRSKSVAYCSCFDSVSQLKFREHVTRKIVVCFRSPSAVCVTETQLRQ